MKTTTKKILGKAGPSTSIIPSAPSDAKLMSPDLDPGSHPGLDFPDAKDAKSGTQQDSHDKKNGGFGTKNGSGSKNGGSKDDQPNGGFGAPSSGRGGGDTKSNGRTEKYLLMMAEANKTAPVQKVDIGQECLVCLTGAGATDSITVTEVRKHHSSSSSPPQCFPLTSTSSSYLCPPMGDQSSNLFTTPTSKRNNLPPEPNANILTQQPSIQPSQTSLPWNPTSSHHLQPTHDINQPSIHSIQPRSIISCIASDTQQVDCDQTVVVKLNPDNLNVPFGWFAPEATSHALSGGHNHALPLSPTSSLFPSMEQSVSPRLNPNTSLPPAPEPDHHTFDLQMDENSVTEEENHPRSTHPQDPHYEEIIYENLDEDRPPFQPTNQQNQQINQPQPPANPRNQRNPTYVHYDPSTNQPT